ncbi:MAG TPA: NADH-quinone oxidoreductase subunit A [Ignavibacteriales bacterium]|nr:NADH-quinone oxidoreductase subunit A [Ignavibacteriales bacterium]HPP34527.1 NADH-quinone oxidoreductase subunit A [Ignavibacteriales bacterium]HRR19679.1 NADH-quinone oxidoreductase subunit A [Ignavibacteriales bacterium]
MSNEQVMITEFGKIFLFMLIAVILVVGGVLTAFLIRPSKKTYEKQLTYECGEDPVGTPWNKFNIRFYVTALIFLIFDVEVVLLFPWAIQFKQYGLAGLLIGIIFIVLLGVGMLYEVAKGDINWDK